MKDLQTIFFLALLAAPAFAAPVQFLTNLLPSGAFPSLVKTDPSGNA